MRLAEKIGMLGGVVGILLVLGGCSTAPTVEGDASFDTNKVHIVKHYKDTYYYRPNNAWSYKLNTNSANLNNTTSGGKLKCKENDIWFISIADRAEEEKIRYRYFISLSKLDLEEMKNDPTLIPRRDSIEFKNLIKIDTQMAEQGLIGCTGSIPKHQVEKIIPMSEVAVVPSS